MSGHDRKSFINLYFCPAQSSKRWLLFETWLPFLQNQWKGLSSSVLFSRLCPSLFFLHNPSLCLYLTVKDWSLWVDIFNRQNWRRNSPLYHKHGQFSWTDSSVHKMKLHAWKWHSFLFRQTETLHQDITHTHTQTHARPCVTLHLYASKPLNGLFIQENKCQVE